MIIISQKSMTISVISVIFPTFYSGNRRASILQVLAQSFRKDRDNDMLFIPELSIFLIDSSDLPSTMTLL